jgi:uncharacterized protein
MDAPVFDIHTFFGSSLYGKSLSPDDLDQRRQRRPHLSGLLIPARPKDYRFDRAHADLLEFLSTSQGSGWHGALRVDPWRLEESLSLIKETPLPALFLHPFEEHIYPTHKNFIQVVQAASERGLPLILACGYLPYSHAAQILPLIEKFPKQPFLLTHGGQINICGLHLTEAFEIFSRCPNASFEISGIYRHDYIEQAIAELGPHRVIFGSASPHYDFDYELKRVEYLSLSARDAEQILSKNARRFLNLNTE